MHEEFIERGAELDSTLRVVEEGRVVACVGLIATFYFGDGGNPEVRERVVKALDLYLSRAGDHLRWGVDVFTREALEIAGSNVARPREWMHRLPEREPLEVMLQGGKTTEDADPYRVIIASSPRTSRLSYFSVGVGFSWVTSNDPSMFTQFVLELVNILEPAHGYAGLGASGHFDIGPNNYELQAIVPLIKRFSGLEIDLPTSHCIYLAQENAIKGVNWLTILDQTLVERLGGEERLKQALGEGVTWHASRTGVVIQAGPRPQFGDRNRNEPMTYYRQVARAIKPIRVSSIRGIASHYGFDAERADEWLARFDD